MNTGGRRRGFAIFIDIAAHRSDWLRFRVGGHLRRQRLLNL